eukprot:158595_1
MSKVRAILIFVFVIWFAINLWTLRCAVKSNDNNHGKSTVFVTQITVKNIINIKQQSNNTIFIPRKVNINPIEQCKYPLCIYSYDQISQYINLSQSYCYQEKIQRFFKTPCLFLAINSSIWDKQKFYPITFPNYLQHLFCAKDTKVAEWELKTYHKINNNWTLYYYESSINKNRAFRCSYYGTKKMDLLISKENKLFGWIQTSIGTMRITNINNTKYHYLEPLRGPSPDSQMVPLTECRFNHTPRYWWNTIPGYQGDDMVVWYYKTKESNITQQIYQNGLSQFFRTAKLSQLNYYDETSYIDVLPHCAYYTHADSKCLINGPKVCSTRPKSDIQCMIANGVGYHNPEYVGNRQVGRYTVIDIIQTNKNETVKCVMYSPRLKEFISITMSEELNVLRGYIADKQVFTHVLPVEIQVNKIPIELRCDYPFISTFDKINFNYHEVSTFSTIYDFGRYSRVETNTILKPYGSLHGIEATTHCIMNNHTNLIMFYVHKSEIYVQPTMIAFREQLMVYKNHNNNAMMNLECVQTNFGIYLSWIERFNDNEAYYVIHRLLLDTYNISNIAQDDILPWTRSKSYFDFSIAVKPNAFTKTNVTIIFDEALIKGNITSLSEMKLSVFRIFSKGWNTNKFVVKQFIVENITNKDTHGLQRIINEKCI